MLLVYVHYGDNKVNQVVDYMATMRRQLLSLILLLALSSNLFAQGLPQSLGHPLVNAADIGNEAAVRGLIARGEFVDIRGDFGVTALMRASLRGHTKIVDFLLQQGADVDAIDLGGASALHLAARSGHYEVVRRLLEAGAEVNAADDDGWTPLMRAIANRDTAIVALMSEYKPDLLQKNHYGENGVHLAVKAAKPEMLEVVLQKVSPKDVDAAYLQKLAGKNEAIKGMLQQFCEAGKKGGYEEVGAGKVVAVASADNIEGLPWLADKSVGLPVQNEDAHVDPVPLEFVDQILAAASENLAAEAVAQKDEGEAEAARVQIGRAFRLAPGEIERLLHNEYLQPKAISQLTGEGGGLLRGYNKYISELAPSEQDSPSSLVQN